MQRFPFVLIADKTISLTISLIDISLLGCYDWDKNSLMKRTKPGELV